MISAGLDIGSRTAKLVILDDGRPCEWMLRPTGADPLGAARALIDGRRFDRLAATGYGRHLASEDLADLALTEIKACAMGVHFLQPECRSVIDIGGQDTKVIALGARGGIGNFVMNDRCAAGTGRFLEFMAQTLGLGIEEFGRAACDAAAAIRLNSMCVVFAESEVISLIARGVGGGEIARAVHEAMADRIASLARTIRLDEGDIMLAGGVALNPCVTPLLESRLGRRLIVHERCQFIPALGAAIHAQGT
ncbi:MAG: hypothetical protein KBC96_12350 [Armatimonadetes bacterium]|nr:hypothetical protein [Armatimonadota bacterium]